jgi:hypothetical protein
MTGASSKGVQGADMNDLQTWLAGFIYLSNKTNKRLSKLSMLLYKSHENQIDVHETCKQIATYQKEGNDTLVTMLTEMLAMKEGTSFVKGAMGDILEKAKQSHEMQSKTVKLLEDGSQVTADISAKTDASNQILSTLVEKVQASNEISKEYKEQFIEVIEDAVHRQTGHMDKNAELLQAMLGKQLDTVNQGISRGIETSQSSKEELTTSLAKAVEKQSAHMDRSAEMLVATLSDMFEDMNDKVENNVLEFVQKKSELDEVRGDLELILNSQGDLQGEFTNLIKEMHEHNAQMQKASIHILPLDNSKQKEKKRSIVRKLFSSGE